MNRTHLESPYIESSCAPRHASRPARAVACFAAGLLCLIADAAGAEGRGHDDAAFLRALEKDLRTGKVENAIGLGDSAVQARREGGDLPGARRLREQQIEILRRIGVADTLVAAADYNLGKICYDQHDYAAAETAWRQALPLFASASPPDHRGTVWCLNDIADTRRIAGDFAAAESLLVRAVATSEAHLPRNSAHARLLNNLGALYRDLDRLDDAERLYREALRISQADPAAKPKRIAISYLNLGVLTCDQGRLDEAERLLLHALDLGRKSVQAQDPAGFVYFLSEPATLYARLGRWDESIRLREEALSILSGLEIPHEIYHARILYDTAEALLERGDRARAETLLREALAKRERVLGASHPDVGTTLTALAEVVGSRPAGSREASDYLARALGIFDKSKAQPEVEAEARALQAHLEHATGKRDAALTDMERALTLVEELRPRRGGGDESRIRFLQKFAGYYNEMIAWQVEAGRPEAALDYAERIRARVLHEQLAAGQTNLRRDIPAEVLAPLERREQKAKLRLAGIQQEVTLARANWTPSDRDGVARLASLEKQLDVALRDYRAVSEEIQLQSPAWRRLLQQQEQKLSVRGIQEKLVRPDELLLLYQIGPESSFLFVVPPAPQPLECHPLVIPADVAAGLGVEPGALQSEVLTALVTGKSVAERERSVVGGMVRLRKVTGVAVVEDGTKSQKTAPSGGELAASVGREPAAGVERRAEQSYRLWKVLLPAPVWERVRSVAQVVIVPDGSLHQLPFEALVVQTKPGDPRYWLDAGPAIRYANSITTLLDVAGRHRETGSPARVLTVCDPIFDPQEVAAQTRAAGREVAMSTPVADEPRDLLLRQGAGLPRLPATARESAAIQRAFGAERVVCLRGLDATETQVKAAVGKALYIHIATHGIVDESHEDLLAGLMLTSPPVGERAPADDGCLHLFEIYELPLECELAVLSACETESGRNIQGEGVFALSRGFLVAGAQRTVASLWPVADESTARLVADFFRRVAAAGSTGAIDYAGFLRDAKQKLRRDSRWSDPFFWAPFVMSGIR